MSEYSVADAKASLPSLINRAISGEEVIITRHGKPVAELRPRVTADPKGVAEAHARFFAQRVKLPPGSPTSVELLDMIYDDPDG